MLCGVRKRLIRLLLLLLLKPKGYFVSRYILEGVESAPHVVSVRGPLSNEAKRNNSTRQPSHSHSSTALDQDGHSTAEQLSICSCCNKGYLARQVSPI